MRRGERGRLRAALLRPAGEGMAEWLGLRGEGRGGYIYRADAGPATFTGPCSGRHRGLACRPKHGTDLVPGRHGHAACRASPCRATGRPAGRPEMDMYSFAPAIFPLCCVLFLADDVVRRIARPGDEKDVARRGMAQRLAARAARASCMDIGMEGYQQMNSDAEKADLPIFYLTLANRGGE